METSIASAGHASTRRRPVANGVNLEMKVSKSCTFGRVFKDIPGICIALQAMAAIILTGVLSYLFISQEILK